ncbi:MAG: hypothetical protein KF803_07105 [Cyclobacteriaceae bacterium]|nr:hypothetical protein [Cyclobacteriaceae bacterium]
MKLQLNAKKIFAFFLFAMLMGEAHEIAHFIVGKIICGCWPEYRDFNAWRLCKSCKEASAYWYWPTAAGPIFSMTLAWIGMFLLRNETTKMQSLGFVLIWANVPQARIMTVFMGGGDETVVFRNMTLGTEAEPYFRWLAYGVVLLMALPPIIASFRAVKNKQGWLYNVGFMILPLLIIGSYGFVFLNGLLERGFLANVWIMGTPVFITLHTTFVFIVLLLFFRKELFRLVKEKVIPLQL